MIDTALVVINQYLGRRHVEAHAGIVFTNRQMIHTGCGDRHLTVDEDKDSKKKFLVMYVREKSNSKDFALFSTSNTNLISNSKRGSLGPCIQLDHQGVENMELFVLLRKFFFLFVNDRILLRHDTNLEL